MVKLCENIKDYHRKQPFYNIQPVVLASFFDHQLWLLSARNSFAINAAQYRGKKGFFLIKPNPLILISISWKIGSNIVRQLNVCTNAKNNNTHV